MKPARWSGAGLWIARAGGVLMVLGGVGDLTIRRLLSNHRQFLGHAEGAVPAATETLVLALLHALGAALIAAGLAVLVLLHQAQRSGRRTLALAAAAVAILAEGMNAVGMYRTGSPLFVAPVIFLLLVLAGVTLHVGSRGSDGRPELSRPPRQPAG